MLQGVALHSTLAGKVLVSYIFQKVLGTKRLHTKIAVRQDQHKVLHKEVMDLLPCAGKNFGQQLFCLSTVLTEDSHSAWEKQLLAMSSGSPPSLRLAYQKVFGSGPPGYRAGLGSSEAVSKLFWPFWAWCIRLSNPLDSCVAAGSCTFDDVLHGLVHL